MGWTLQPGTHTECSTVMEYYHVTTTWPKTLWICMSWTGYTNDCMVRVTSLQTYIYSLYTTGSLFVFVLPCKQIKCRSNMLICMLICLDLRIFLVNDSVDILSGLYDLCGRTDKQRMTNHWWAGLYYDCSLHRMGCSILFISIDGALPIIPVFESTPLISYSSVGSGS